MTTTRIRSRAAAIILAASVLAGPAAAASGQDKPAGLTDRHRDWLETDAAPIITTAEREVFLRLGSEGDRDRFIEEFWLQRDPTPGTPNNEFRSEHFKRLAFADVVFGKKRGRDGRKTVRGRLYARFGPPLEVARIKGRGLRPLEMWTYPRSAAGGGSGLFRILFYRPSGSGEYTVYDPGTDKPIRLVPAPAKAGSEASAPAAAGPAPFEGAPQWGPADQAAFRRLAEAGGAAAAECALTCWPGDRGPEAARRSSETLAGKAPRRVDDGWAARWERGRGLPAVGYSVQSVAGQACLRAYAGPDGSRTLHVAAVPERLAFESFDGAYQAILRTTITLLDGSGRTIFERAQDNVVGLAREEMKATIGKTVCLCDVLPLLPAAGALTVRWRLENLVDKTFLTAEETLPAAGGGAPAMTPPVLGRRAAMSREEAGAGRRAFRIGDIQFDPAPDAVFETGEEAGMFLQVSGPGWTAGNAGLIKARLRAAAGGATRTASLPLSEAPAGNAWIWLPVADLAAGRYEVDVDLVDGAGRTVAGQKTALQLRHKPGSGSWIIASSLPPARDPSFAFVLGKQGGGKDGNELLAQAWRANEDSLELAVGYAESLLEAGDFRPACDVLRRYENRPEAGFALFAALAKAAAGAGQSREAAEAWEKALLRRRNDPAALNGLGECRLALNDLAAAKAAWTRSLDMDPDQPEVKKKLDSLR